MQRLPPLLFTRYAPGTGISAIADNVCLSDRAIGQNHPQASFLTVFFADLQNIRIFVPIYTGVGWHRMKHLFVHTVINIERKGSRVFKTLLRQASRRSDDFMLYNICITGTAAPCKRSRQRYCSGLNRRLLRTMGPDRARSVGIKYKNKETKQKRVLHFNNTN